MVRPLSAIFRGVAYYSRSVAIRASWILCSRLQVISLPPSFVHLSDLKEGAGMDGIDMFFMQYGLATVFLVLLIKTIGVPLPIPGDLIILAAAVRVAQGKLVGWQAFLRSEERRVGIEWRSGGGRCRLQE